MSELFNVSVNELFSGKRLSSEEYRNAAEENLAQTIKASSFTLKDKIDFYKKKWLKDHIAIIVFWGICIVGVLMAGFILNKYWMGYVSFIFLVVGHGWRNNTMMAYVENNAYDGSGK